jgi:hypothetical protein
MKVRVLTLPWDDASGQFDSRELSGFIEPELNARIRVETT